MGSNGFRLKGIAYFLPLPCKLFATERSGPSAIHCLEDINKKMGVEYWNDLYIPTYTAQAKFCCFCINKSNKITRNCLETNHVPIFFLSNFIRNILADDLNASWWGSSFGYLGKVIINILLPLLPVFCDSEWWYLQGSHILQYLQESHILQYLQGSHIWAQ